MADEALSSIKAARRAKLDAWRGLKVNPYPAESGRNISMGEVRQKPLNEEGANTDKLTVAGRITAMRTQGGLAFLDLIDESGKIQILFKQDELSPELFEHLELLDLGDFIEVSGSLFTTKRGELTVKAEGWKLLTKSLYPLPDKWHGLKDPELKFREREVDFIMNPEERQIFTVRAKTMVAMRSFLTEQGFLEVETPILQNIPGGASAKPFMTEYNAYDTQVYLRIAPEIYLKRLLVGGFERVFELGPAFRNEGVDATHLPEHSHLEFYAAYLDDEALMRLTEDFIVSVVQAVLGKTEVERDGQVISVKKPFKRLTFAELTGGKEDDAVFKQAIKDIKEPTFITNHPISMLPLAKMAPDGKTVKSFQLIMGGLELVKAFSELNDPLDQRARFEEQEKARAAGDEEAQRLDEEFLHALEVGMPPAAGFGLGVDRLVMLLSGVHSIREAILFPYIKPKGQND